MIVAYLSRVDYYLREVGRDQALLIEKGKTMLIYIGTTNTTSGNPRRGWIKTTAMGQILGWIEEGYEGSGAIAGYDDGETMKINVTPSEYKRLKGLALAHEKRSNA